MNEIKTVIESWRDSDPAAQVILMNHNQEPVAALYLNRLKDMIDEIAICESQTNEKYYLYLNGIAIFFTFYKKS